MKVPEIKKERRIPKNRKVDFLCVFDNIVRMKKLFFVFAVSLFAFVSCLGSSPRVEFLSFYSNGAVELHIAPDYEERVLKVKYYDDEELSGDGNLGEEYYDRFNEVVKIFYGYDEVFIPDVHFSGEDISFGVFVMGEYGESFVIRSFDDFGERDFEYVQTFYVDVLNLLTQDVQI